MDLFSSFNDNALMEQILATHAPDGREFDVKPFLHIIEDVFKRVGFGIPGFIQGTQVQFESIDDKALYSGDFSDMLDLLSYTISKISCEISCKCSGGGDAHATTVAIFNTLTSYSWEAKLVLALAAFAVNYAEFWLGMQVYPTNPLAKSVVFLKNMTKILKHVQFWEQMFEACNNLSEAMLDVTKCFVEFEKLPSQYITLSTPQMVTATAHIRTAVYWSIRSIVACTSQIMGLKHMDRVSALRSKASSSEVRKLLSLVDKVKNIHSLVVKQITLCQQEITYSTLVDDIRTSHIDNMKILKHLIYAKENQLLLFDGSKDTGVIIEVLSGKHVLLFITDLKIPTEELSILKEMFNESRKQPLRPERQYEVVWLHVKDDSIKWDVEEEVNFKGLRKKMPWYSLSHSELDPGVIRFIKKEWKFNNNPLLVLLDPHGEVVNPTEFI